MPPLKSIPKFNPRKVKQNTDARRIIADKVKDIMESAVELEVPNKVDYESGPNWGTIK